MKPLPNKPLIARGRDPEPAAPRRAGVRARPPRLHPGASPAATEHLPGGSGANLRSQLNQLATKDLLHFSGERFNKRWYPGARPAPQGLLGVVPPRRVQVMLGPVYVPPSVPAQRPGAMDFKACASRGHPC